MSTNKGPAAPDEAASIDDVGQGELYAPKHAVRLMTTHDEPPRKDDDDDDDDDGNRNSSSTKAGLKPVLEKAYSKVVAADVLKRNLSPIKDKLMDKLAAAPVPTEALDNARHFVESVIRDVANAAHGLTKDALHRIKTHLTDILIPSLSPHQTAKMVEDAEKEAMGARKSGEDDGPCTNQLGSPRSKL